MKTLFSLSLLLAFTASAFEFTGKVVGVSDGAMAAAETRARAAKVGIWSMANPTPPWDFRRGKGVAKLEIGQPNTAVFVTRSGAKFHRGDCRFVARSKLPTTLARAMGRYGPCGVCAPPVLKVVAQPIVPPSKCS